MAVAVVQKTFVALEALAACGPCSLAQLSRSARFPKATLFRILRTLGGMGYVKQDSQSGAWSVTDQLAELAGNNVALKRRALPVMEKLFERFGETVNLGVLRGIHIRYLHVIETRKALRHIVQPGAADPFYSTALGRALAAHLPADGLRRLFEQLDRQPVQNGIPRRAQLLKVLNASRAQGWAIDDEETVPGVVCFGAPLLEDGAPIAAVSVSIPTARLSPALRKQVVAALKECVR
jgi:DNA-binding IclR family transcriptional regulator